MQKILVDGYKRFREEYFKEHQELFTLLASGQSPHTLVIACSDSRVDPQIIFNVGPGELFVIRNVANLVPPYSPDAAYHGTSAALEFGIKVLNVKHVVVMGHSQCGGVRAMLQGTPDSCQDFLSHWISLGKTVREMARRRGPLTDESFAEGEHANVRESLSNLLTFPWVRERVERGELELHGCWFNIQGGMLFSLDTPTPEAYDTSHA